MMHSSLAVTVEGLPFGLAVIKFWSRNKFKGFYKAEAIHRKSWKNHAEVELATLTWVTVRQATELTGKAQSSLYRDMAKGRVS